MTVKELKSFLDNCDDNDIVVVRGYEEGVDEVKHISIGYCSAENPNNPEWEGRRSFDKNKTDFFEHKSIWLRE